jgi:hypothetical protein
VSAVIAASKATESQLLLLHKIMELVGETRDVATIEVEHPPKPMGPGVPGTWTRTTGFLERLDAATVIYERLGGPMLPDAVRQFVRKAKQLPTKQGEMVGEASTVIQALTNFAENIVDVTMLS